MSAHTPGPWRYDFVDGYCGELLAPTGQVVATFVDEPNEDDARLIAAAPDLLEDLQEAVTTLRRYEVLHRAKGTADSDAKAEANAALASRFEATIASATRSSA